MLGEKFEDTLARVSKDVFVEYYSTHNQQDTKEHFEMGWYILKEYISFYSISKSREEISSTASLSKGAVPTKFEKVNNSISTDAILKYYIEENHTYIESAVFFGISSSMFLKILNTRGIHKPKDKVAEIIKSVKEEKYGDPNYNNRTSASATCLGRYGVTNPSQMGTFSCKAKASWEANGYDHPMHNEVLVNKVVSKKDYGAEALKRKCTCLERYGTDNPATLDAVKDKIKQSLVSTFNERYSCDCYWTMDGALKPAGSSHSKPNDIIRF